MGRAGICFKEVGRGFKGFRVGNWCFNEFILCETIECASGGGNF